MNARFTYEGVHLSSLRQINALPEQVKDALYRSLVPLPLLASRCVDPNAPADFPPSLSIQIRCQENISYAEIDVRHPADPRDPVLYVQMADTATGQLEVLLLFVNDPRASRYDIDRDWEGASTKRGTQSRNLPAEVEAMRAGLAPGQVRQGLRVCRELIPGMERFVASLGKDRFFIEPLAYHNAIAFERYGFAYVTGQAKVGEIDRSFRAGGALLALLDGSTLFRQPGQACTVRGRSWAIHDGVLGEPWSGVRMYKRVSYDAGICTFPDAVY
jgi:hypothetical protein